MGKLSDGQKSRLIFAIVSMSRPNILLCGGGRCVLFGSRSG
jgi:ABC-type Mn2+/Zn2+ transport system ATPase subunit